MVTMKIGRASRNLPSNRANRQMGNSSGECIQYGWGEATLGGKPRAASTRLCGISKGKSQENWFVNYWEARFAIHCAFTTIWVVDKWKGFTRSVSPNSLPNLFRKASAMDSR